jgi:hypothetical protein
MDMRFYWLQDRVEQGQFKKIWAPGKINLADYHSKVQPTLVHRTPRPIYLYEKGKSPTTLQGCDKILESLATGTPTNAIRYLTKTGSCNRASFSPPTTVTSPPEDCSQNEVVAIGEQMDGVGATVE